MKVKIIQMIQGIYKKIVAVTKKAWDIWLTPTSFIVMLVIVLTTGEWIIIQSFDLLGQFGFLYLSNLMIGGLISINMKKEAPISAIISFMTAFTAAQSGLVLFINPTGQATILLLSNIMLAAFANLHINK